MGSLQNLMRKMDGFISMELDCEGLEILDFRERSIMSWLAELMKHRDAADSKRYRVLAAKFIEKYGVDTSRYDVIKRLESGCFLFLHCERICPGTI